MRMHWIALVVVAACNSSSPVKPAIDAPPPKRDAPIDAPPVDEGMCASCTATMCGSALSTCAGSQACLNDLITFNNCLTAHATMCGTTFAAGGSPEAGLWSCLAAMCPSCGSN